MTMELCAGVVLNYNNSAAGVAFIQTDCRLLPTAVV